MPETPLVAAAVVILAAVQAYVVSLSARLIERSETAVTWPCASTVI